jgi:hypothetical protein
MRTVSSLTVVTTAGPRKPKLSHTAFDDYVADMDSLDKMSTAMTELADRIEEASEEKSKAGMIANLHGTVQFWINEKDFAATCAKCHAFEDLFNDDKWEKPVIDGKEQWFLKPEYIAERLALLINSFPNNGPRHPDDFVELLLEEVIAVDTAAITLEAACRQLVRTGKFVPSIAEVLEALREQTDLFINRWDALDVIVGEQERLKTIWNELVLEARKQIEKKTETQ